MSSTWLQRNGKWIVLGVTILYAGFFWWYSVRINQVFYNYSSDTGNMWQTMWNLAHGHGFTFTHPGTGLTTNRLATHADLFLVVLAPLTWIFRSPNILYGLQAAVVAMGGWLVWRVAEKLWHRPTLSLSVACSYFFYGPVQFSVLWQFHVYTFFVTIFLAMVEAIIARRRVWLVWLWFGIALLLKEQIGFFLGPAAALIWWWKRQRRLAWAMLVVGILYSLLAFSLLIPLARPAQSPHFAWNDLYGDLGATPTEQLGALANPRLIVERIFTPTHLTTTLGLVGPLFFLPLLSPLAVVAILALLPMWMSRLEINQSAYYIAHLGSAALLLVGLVHGLDRVRTRWPAWWAKPTIIVGLISGTIVGSVSMSPLPWSLMYRPLMMQHDPELLAFIHQVSNRIPVSASIGANRETGPYLRNRQNTYPLLPGLSAADYVIVFEPQAFSGARNKTYAIYQPVRDFLAHSPAYHQIYSGYRGVIYQRNWMIPPDDFSQL